MNDVRKLIDRLAVIAGQEYAGNKKCYNEKVSIANMISSKFSDFLVNDPKGIGYLIKCINMRPSKFWEGKGLINDIINALPFELHVPGYNYLVPGTKLSEQLARGDEGINPLDEAAKENDIFIEITQILSRGLWQIRNSIINLE
jgi:hypothetical protein